MTRCLTNHAFGFLRPIAVAVALTFAIRAFAGNVQYNDKGAPPQPPPCDWTGFYIGVNGGLAKYQFRVTDLDNFFSFDTRTLEDLNFIGGGQIGYDYQTGSAVFGIEADGDYVNTEVHTHSTAQEDHGEINFMGTVRGRAGIAVQNTLLYFTAGVAFADGDRSEHFISQNITWKVDDFRVGWTAGVGMEYAMNCHWSFRGEALFANFEDDTASRLSPNSGRFRYQFGDEMWTVRVGLNYKFGSGR